MLKKAKSQVGKGGKKFREYAGLPSDAAWCGAFVFWLLSQVGTHQYMNKKDNPFYVPNIEAWARKNGLTVSKGKAGDIITFDWDKNGYGNHVGIIYKKNKDGSYTTIEGNTGGGDGKVMMRTRYPSQVGEIIRLKKKGEKKKKTKTVEHKATYMVLPSDGLNVRSEYRVGSKKKTALPKGKKIDVTKKHGNWVYAPKYKGWLCMKKSKDTYLKKV